MARKGFPGGMPGGMNMQSMMKQAQAMQQKMQKIQEELAEKEVTATAGGGAVTVTANGKKEISKVEIKPEAVDPDDVEMLEDLIVAAVNEAMRMADEMAQEDMAQVTGGLNLGGLFTHQHEGFLERYAKMNYLGRMANETDIQGVLVFLASDASAYITGTSINVDGGYTAR